MQKIKSKKVKEQMVPGEMTGKMYPLSEMRERQRQESITLNGVKEDMRRAEAKSKTDNTVKKFNTTPKSELKSKTISTLERTLSAAKPYTKDVPSPYTKTVSAPVRKSIAAMAMKQTPVKMAYMKKMAESKKKK